MYTNKVHRLQCSPDILAKEAQYPVPQSLSQDLSCMLLHRLRLRMSFFLVFALLMSHLASVDAQGNALLLVMCCVPLCKCLCVADCFGRSL